jgi:hypothetical protein
MIQGPQKSVPDHFGTALNLCTPYKLIPPLVQILRLDWLILVKIWLELVFREENLTKMGFGAQFPASEPTR